MAERLCLSGSSIKFFSRLRLKTSEA